MVYILKQRWQEVINMDYVCKSLSQVTNPCRSLCEFSRMSPIQNLEIRACCAYLNLEFMFGGGGMLAEMGASPYTIFTTRITHSKRLCTL